MRRLYSNALSERPSCSSLTDAVAMKSVRGGCFWSFALSNALAPDERCVSIPSAMPIVLCYICIAERERAQPEIGVKTRLRFEIFPNHGFCPYCALSLAAYSRFMRGLLRVDKERHLF